MGCVKKGIPERGIRQSTNHRNLHGCHDLPRADTQPRKPEDTIACGLDQSFQKSPRFRKSACTQICFHRDLEKAIWNALCLCFHFANADASQFGIGKKAIRNLSATRHAVAAGQIGMDNAEIVDTDVCELRAACNLADRPNVWCRRLESLVDLDISAVGQFDASQLDP